MSNATLINGRRAATLVSSIDDPKVRALVRAAVGIAVRHFTARGPLTFGEPEDVDPAVSFDMLLYAQLMLDLFSTPSRIERVLQGDLDDQFGFPLADE